jgi:hypothetical protein
MVNTIIDCRRIFHSLMASEFSGKKKDVGNGLSLPDWSKVNEDGIGEFKFEEKESPRG